MKPLMLLFFLIVLMSHLFFHLQYYQADHDIQNAIRRHCCQHLPVNQLRNALQRHPECIVDFPQQEEQHRKQTDHGPVALPAKFGVYLIRIVAVPAGREWDCDHRQVDELHDL